MLHKEYSLLKDSNATLKSYVAMRDKYDRRKNKRPAVIICPGGGYQFVSFNEGEPVALAFAARGYQAFVVNYSVGMENPFPTALLELAFAVKMIREHGDAWDIDTDDITIVGFSAGGHLALCLGVFYARDCILSRLNCTKDKITPNALILGYPAITLHKWNTACPNPEISKMMDDGTMPDLRGFDIPQLLAGKMDVSPEDAEKFNLLNHFDARTPPCFLWGTNEDSVIHPSDLWNAANLLRMHGIPYELHIFGHGPHGQGLADATAMDSALIRTTHMYEWLRLSLKWLEEIRGAQ